MGVGIVWKAISYAIALGSGMALLSSSAWAETGTVYQCSVGAGVGFIVSPPPQHGSYLQPITINVHAFSLNPQSLEATQSGDSISVTLSGSALPPSPQTPGACGQVQMNHLAPGRYVLTLSLIRDGQAPVPAQTQTLLISPSPPPRPPSLIPRVAPGAPPIGYDFAPTQSVGEVDFSHSVSADGAALVTIPIKAPLGRQGVQPSLTLSYSSRNENSPLGVGWRLSGLSSITACRQSPALDGSYGGQYPDRFCLDGQRLVPAILALDGQRLPPISGTEYRTETNPDSKIVAHGPADYPDWFELYSPGGLIFRYAGRAGDGSQARLEGHVVSCVWGKYVTDQGWLDQHGGCAAGALQRRAWLLDEVADRFGNRMEIDYDVSEPLLPIEIRYTYHLNRTAADGYFPSTKKIAFEYEERPDIREFSLDGMDFDSSTVGGTYRAAKRLKTIKVFGPLGLSDASYAHQSGLLRQYELTYTLNPVTDQSTLTQVLERGGEQLDLPSKAPLKFSYSGSSMEFTDKTFVFVPNNNVTGIQTFGLDGFRVADVNGDGLDDLLYRSTGNLISSSWYYRLSDGQMFGAETRTNVPPAPDKADFGVGFADLDRNGTVDAVIPAQSSDPYNFSANYNIGRGDRNGIFQTSLLPTDVYKLQTEVAPYPQDRIAAIADLNGDGLPDLALRYGGVANSLRWGFALNKSDQAGIRFSDAMDFMTSGWMCTPEGDPFSGRPFTNCANAADQDPAFVVDIDGNGVNELIVPRIARATDVGQARPGNRAPELTALGFSVGQRATEKRSGLSSEQMPRVFIDVNGDGLANSVHALGGTLFIAINRGGSYGPPVPVNWFSHISAEAVSAFSQPNEIRVGDFNNDGLDDIYLVSSGILLQSDGRRGFIEKHLSIPLGDDTCQTPACPAFARRGWDQIIDFNGDGLIDLLQVRGGATHVLQRTGPAPAQLEQITGGPLTPEVRLIYRPAPEVHTAATCTFPQNCLNKGMWLVSEVGVKANVTARDYPNGFNRTSYIYKGGRFDVRGRGWLGFAETTATDEQTGTITTTEFDNVTKSNLGIASPYRYPGAFRPARKTI